MCTSGCIEFARSHPSRADISGQSVLEVGSCDVNGTIRRIAESLGPAVERFGTESFGVVVTTEMLEHVRDWRAVIHNLKSVLRTRLYDIAGLVPRRWRTRSRAGA